MSVSSCPNTLTYVIRGICLWNLNFLKKLNYEGSLFCVLILNKFTYVIWSRCEYVTQSLSNLLFSFQVCFFGYYIFWALIFVEYFKFAIKHIFSWSLYQLLNYLKRVFLIISKIKLLIFINRESNKQDIIVKREKKV